MLDSRRVEQYIRDRQHQVLVKAVDALTHASLPQLPAELHRLLGTLGTFQLDRAVGLLRPLHSLVKDPEVAPEDVSAARAAVVQDLAALTGPDAEPAQ